MPITKVDTKYYCDLREASCANGSKPLICGDCVVPKSGEDHKMLKDASVGSREIEDFVLTDINNIPIGRAYLNKAGFYAYIIKGEYDQGQVNDIQELTALLERKLL